MNELSKIALGSKVAPKVRGSLRPLPLPLPLHLHLL